MKNRATIHYGAGVHTVTVNAGRGTPVVFDLNKMDKHAHRNFITTFVRTFRDAEVAAGRLKAA